MSEAAEQLDLAWRVFGFLYCTECENRVDLSDADTFTEARDIAVEHHEQHHD